MTKCLNMYLEGNNNIPSKSGSAIGSGEVSRWSQVKA